MEFPWHRRPHTCRVFQEGGKEVEQVCGAKGGWCAPALSRIPLGEEAKSPAERKGSGWCWAGEVAGTGQKFMSGTMDRGWGPRSERARPCGWRLPPALLSGSAAEKLGGRAAPNQGSESWQASSEGFDKRVAGMRKLS